MAGAVRADNRGMDIASATTAMAGNAVMAQAQVSLLRKSMDMALQNNAQLLAAMPAPHTGSVDTYA